MNTILSFVFKHLSLIMGVILAIILVCWAKSCSYYEKEIEQSKNYIKDYENTVSGKMRELQMTQEQFLYSKDSIIEKLRDSLKVKVKNVKSVEYIQTFFTVYDTIRVPDSAVTVHKDYDSTIVYNPQTKFNISFEDSCNCMIFTPEISNEMFVVSSYKKEIIGKPSKVFFIRWFQKKRKFITVDITNSNDLIETRQTRFINILKE